MMRWDKGSQDIKRMLVRGELQKIIGAEETTQALLSMAWAHVEAAKVCVPLDPSVAFALAYDATRKAATAVLSHQGLRPTTQGGHLAVVYAIEAQSPGVPGLKSLDRLRRRRNETEYPDPVGYDAIGAGEAGDAIVVAEAAVGTARTLVDRPEIGLFR